MSHIHRLGAQVVLKNPLPSEPRGPWKVVGVKTTKAPPEYKLFYKEVGKGRFIDADEGELLAYSDAPMVSRQANSQGTP